MRPVRLELNGFTTFREPVVVDFDGVDLFALVGATGSGKTSLLDGMCFALYGTVPRLDRRAVEPVISSGRNEARIRFDFTVGETAYTATRVVRRGSRGGASTKEARLESAGEVVASEADDVTGAVERLLGLGFEQFTKCVVLPQGEFARFLHDTPKGRQELLVRLLELGVYSEMRQLAHARRVTAEAKAETAAAQLERLGGATPEALEQARRRTAALEALLGVIEAATPEREALAERLRTAETAAAEASRALDALQALRPPEGLDRTLDRIAETTATALAKAEKLRERCQRAEVALNEAEKERAELPDAGALAQAGHFHEQRRTLDARIAKGEPLVTERAVAVTEAHERLRAADEEAGTAEAAVAELRDEHAAHALAARLTVGEPCPVCAAAVAAVPDRKAPAALAQAEARLGEARDRRGQAEAALREATNEHARFQEALGTLRSEREALDQALGERPDVAKLAGLPEEDLATLRAGLAAADGALTRARDEERAAREASKDAEDELASARAGAELAWSGFDAARDAVAALGPPPADRRDARAAWTALLDWRREREPGLREQVEVAAAARAGAVERLTALEEDLRQRCEEEGITPGERPRDAVADALAAQRSAVTRIETDLELAGALRTEQETLGEAATIAKALGGHLAANRFEQWLLDEALQQLAEGASGVLRQLSSEQYSLAIDGHRNFLVVDHRNADERRPAKTLSGGETFLASLALALTLAEHLAALAVSGAPRLESIFLDEGFGTLDADTLDVVAAAIEELGATGRTVGLVTHVRELAARMPVRYEVRKTPTGSAVDRLTT